MFSLLTIPRGTPREEAGEAPVFGIVIRPPRVEAAAHPLPPVRAPGLAVRAS